MPVLWTPWIHGNDGVRNYAYARSFWIDHDFDFRNEFQHYAQLGEYQIHRTDPVTGLPGNALGIGSSILWSPFFLIAHANAEMIAGAHSEILGAPADGYSPIYARYICFGSTLYAIFGLILLTHLLFPFGRAAALIATFAAWFGSPLWFYMYLHPSMSHACSFFLCTFLTWQCIQWRARSALWKFFVIGLTSGLVIITRFSDSAMLLLPFAYWITSMRGKPFRIYLLSASIALIGFAIAMSPQMIAWHSFSGSAFAGPRDYQLRTSLSLFSSPHFFDLLFSGWRGLFIWSPVLFIGFIGFIFLLRKKDPLLWTLGLVFLIQVWVIGGWNAWWGGASFGQRFFINLVPLFALGLAYAWQLMASRNRKMAYAALLALCMIWSGGLAIQYIAQIIDREKALTIHQLASNQISKVPQWIIHHPRLAPK